MSLKFCSFSSDSSGNCYGVADDKTTIIIDAGISGKKTLDGLASMGKTPENVKAVLFTHEHYDHVKGARVLAKKLDNAIFYCSKGTKNQICDKCSEIDFVEIEAGERTNVGDLIVETFNLSHDAAEPIGYAISNEKGKIVIATDTGCITPEIRDKINEADILVLEANHETNILKMGDYPYELKLRILGDQGHLSNETAGECLCDFVKHKKGQGTKPQIILAHLSKHNNTPAQAFLTVNNLLEEAGYKEGKDYILSIAVKDRITPIFSV